MGTSTVIESRLDICKLATIHKYLLTKGLNINNRSLLVRTVIEIYEGLITSSSSANITPFESNSEAFAYLSRHGITFKQGSKGHRDIMKSLQDDSINDFELNTVSGVDKDKMDSALDILKTIDNEN